MTGKYRRRKMKSAARSNTFVMRFSACILLFFAASCPFSPAQGQDVNYDENKVGSYSLPDLFIDLQGNPITSKEQWLGKRRPEILALFKQHVYGKLPGATSEMRFNVTSVDTLALNGRATRKEITVYFTASSGSPSMDILLYLPNHDKRPVPIFIGLNFYGNHSIYPDAKIALSQRWMRNNEAYQIINNKATEGSRGVQASRWPIDSIIARGYGVATAYYGDIEPDHEKGWQTGIRSTLQNKLSTGPDEWGAIGAWAWGLCRILDYLQTDKQVNAKQATVVGHSRLGKAALWAGANDERFAMVIANCSGEGGAALARRNFGETVERINTVFPYWFGPRFKQYNKNVSALPVDQHMLLATIAPRPLMVASANDDRWADPRGEFLSLVNATPAYELFGKKGMEVSDVPLMNTPILRDVGYKIREGKHDLTITDWKAFIEFADLHLKRK